MDGHGLLNIQKFNVQQITLIKFYFHRHVLLDTEPYLLLSAHRQ